MSDEKALVVCAQGRDKLRQWLEALRFQAIAFAGGAVEARRRIAGDGYALVLINAPLPDETGFELAVELTERTSAAVVLLARNELIPLIAEPLTEAGALLVPKPLQPHSLEQAVRLSVATRRRMLRYKAESERLQAKYEELKLIDRAKCLLIERERVTEDEAHRLLEKRAMDERLSRVEVARAILRRFEL